jgi:hypothetical protein
MRVAMTVLRDGYYDGLYPRAGDTITVEPGLVEALEVSGFAMRQAAAPPAADPAPRPAKGSKPHGR